MLQAEGVRKAYGSVVALDGVDLTVAAGEVVGLVGPNGAGKTSLVSIAAGLRRPDEGRVEIGGVDVGRLANRDKLGMLVGLAPQETAVYPTITVRENLTVFAELAGLRRQAGRARVAETAEALGLTDLLGRRADTLSGGQRRRLHTGMALIHRPPLLLLDEPTVGADIESRARLLELVRGLAAGGAAVVYSTHYLPEVEQLGATIAVLDRGRILARGPLAELLATHARAAVELVFDGPPPPLDGFPDAVVDGNRARIPAEAPGEAAAAVLGVLGPAARRLTAIEIVQPTLESVYLTVTGRRYDAGGEDPAHPDADQDEGDAVAVA